MAANLPGQVFDGQETQANGQGSAVIDRLNDSVKKWFNDQNGTTLVGALAFVPFIVQSAYFEGQLTSESIELHKGSGGVVFSDASGFTALTEKLAKKSNGAELLSQCLTSFFTPLIDLINAYRGDTIKFSGDALMIYFPSVDDVKCPAFNGIVPPHGSYGLPDLGAMTTAVLRASACCIEIHKRLHMFDTGVDDVRLCLHIGVGCGEIRILQVGGVVPPETHVERWEYLISGAPLEQISIAEPLAKNGETCLSPQAWEYVRDCVIEGAPLEDRPDFHLLLRMDESKYTFPTIKYATQLYDVRADSQFSLSELNICRRYIPSAVYKQIEAGTLKYANEMRVISVIFIAGSGLDMMSDKGPRQAHELMSSVQKVCYGHEGTLNKFLIDDKGMLFLLVFGLPPLVHPDDPTRAVIACQELAQVFRRLDLVGKFGVTTGRNYCGVCGSAKRMEYTVLGDTVNLSARLMSNAPALGVLCDEETSQRSTGEVIYKALQPIKVKGKANPIPIFKPFVREVSAQIGLTIDRKIRFPWYEHPADGSTILLKDKDIVSATKVKVQQLCSVSKWAGITKVMEMLGGAFNRQLHQVDQTIPSAPPKSKAPPGSPFAEGGLVVLDGKAGLGKVELAEHIVMHCATQFHMLPVFGTMGPRPGDSTRMAAELLRSTISVFRHLDQTVPDEDNAALGQIMGGGNKAAVDELCEFLQRGPGQNGAQIFDRAVQAVISLLQKLKTRTSVLVVLMFEHGTSLFEKTTKEDSEIFWKMTTNLCQLVQKEKSIAGLILCKGADPESAAVRMAKETNSFVELKGLSEENILEYMANYLGVPEQTLPPPLRRFVSQVTDGNALYIRETLDQLMNDQTLKIKPGASATLGPGALDRIDIAGWSHTMMVGGTACLLESLDPIEAAALKMSTCFEGPFTLPDLAATNCSQWGGATHFDLLRLFKATQKLIKMGIIDTCPPPAVTSPRSGGNADERAHEPDNKEAQQRPYGDTQYFQMKSMLIRTVGASMVLEAQKKSVKRNALIDRVLKNDLPERMTALEAKKSLVHIPWYYERALRWMM